MADLRVLPDDKVVVDSDWLVIQTNAEDADHDLVLDLVSGGGIASGLDLTEQGAPNLTLQLAAGVAYDAAGRRVNVPAAVTVNLAADSDGVSTSVGVGLERYVAVYVRFDRTEEDAYTADAVTTYTTQRETYEVRVVAGAAAATGLGVVPAAPTGSPILLGRVLLINGQTTILTNQVRLVGVPVLHRNDDLYDDATKRYFEVSTADPPGLTVIVSAGKAVIDEVLYEYAGGTTAAFVAPAVNPRIDLIALNSTGVLTVVAGTEAASPARPSTKGYLPIAYVTLAVGQTAILDGHLADARAFLKTTTARRRYHEEVGVAAQTVISLAFAYTLGAHALEVSVDGVVLAESQYTETSTTSLTLVSPLAGAEVVVVRALETSPLETVSLDQVTDDLSGMLFGGDVHVEDRGSGVRAYVDTIALLVIGNRSYRASSGSHTPSGLTPSTWYYLYAYISAGAIAYTLSTVLPDDALTWRSGSFTHRFLAAIRTDTLSVPVQCHRRGGFTLYDRGAITSAAILDALTGGVSAAYAAVSLATMAPPHARAVRLELEVAALAAGAGGAQFRTTGAAGGITELVVEANAAAQTVQREVEMVVDSVQSIDYRLKAAYAGTVAVRVLGFWG